MYDIYDNYDNYDSYEDFYDINRKNKNHGDPCGDNRRCRSVTKKPIDISTPITVEPNVRVGRINTECADSEILWRNERKSGCRRTCEFVVKQTIFVEIPISYDVNTDVGESFIDCRL